MVTWLGSHSTAPFLQLPLLLLHSQLLIFSSNKEAQVSVIDGEKILNNHNTYF